MRVERRAVPHSEVALYEAAGWHKVMNLPQPERGTDALMERESVDVPASRLLVLSVGHRARLDAYAAAIGTDSAAVVEGWIEKHCAGLDVYQRAEGTR